MRDPVARLRLQRRIRKNASGRHSRGREARLRRERRAPVKPHLSADTPIFTRRAQPSRRARPPQSRRAARTHTRVPTPSEHSAARKDRSRLAATTATTARSIHRGCALDAARYCPQGWQFLLDTFNMERDGGRLAKSRSDARISSRKVSPFARSGWGWAQSAHLTTPENAHLQILGAGRKGMLGVAPVVPNRPLPQTLTFGGGRVICIPR